MKAVTAPLKVFHYCAYYIIFCHFTATKFYYYFYISFLRKITMSDYCCSSFTSTLIMLK
jgi:hypothetical protein